MDDLELQKAALFSKALKLFPNSKKQLDIRKQIDEINKKIMAKKKAVKKGSAEAKAKMAKVRAARAKKAPKKAAKKTAFKEERQIPVNWTNSGGYLYRYNKQADKRKKALPSGQRISKDGDVYYEYRVNRSDKTGSLTGIKLNFANELSKYVKVLEEKQRLLIFAKDNIKRKNNVAMNKDMVKMLNTQIRSLKTHINQLKRKI